MHEQSFIQAKLRTFQTNLNVQKSSSSCLFLSLLSILREKLSKKLVSSLRLTREAGNGLTNLIPGIPYGFGVKVLFKSLKSILCQFGNCEGFQRSCWFSSPRVSKSLVHAYYKIAMFSTFGKLTMILPVRNCFVHESTCVIVNQVSVVFQSVNLQRCVS